MILLYYEYVIFIDSRLLPAYYLAPLLEEGKADLAEQLVKRLQKIVKNILKEKHPELVFKIVIDEEMPRVDKLIQLHFFKNQQDLWLFEKSMNFFKKDFVAIIGSQGQGWQLISNIKN